jgi:hypothetical protein
MKKSIFPSLLLTLALAGCGGSGNGPTGPGYRAFNGISVVPLVVTSGTTTIANPLPYATESGNTRSPYTNLAPGSSTVLVTDGTNTLGTVTENLLNGQNINIIVTPTVAGNLLVLGDDFSQLAGTEVRFVNAASTIASADIVLTPQGAAALPTITIPSGTVNPTQPPAPGFLYTPITSGPYQVQVFPTGQENGPPLISETIQMINIRRWTFILTDPPQGQTSPVLVQVQDSQLLNPNG